MQTLFGLTVVAIFSAYIYLRVFGYGKKKNRD